MRHRTTRSVLINTVAAVSIGVIWPAPARGQQTRAEEIAEKQREKAQQASPYQPSGFERTMTRLENNFASPPSGFYPVFNSVYPGGGFTVGPGYRRFFGRQAVFDVFGLYSLKSYKAIEAGVRSPWTGKGKVTLNARAGWLDAPEVAYFGEGMNLNQTRANFRLQQGYAAFTAGLRPNTWTRFMAKSRTRRTPLRKAKGVIRRLRSSTRR